MTILEQLAGFARERVARARTAVPFVAVKEQALSMPRGIFSFEASLKKAGISFICECKKASPSKGLIAPDFPYLQIAREYEAAGVKRNNCALVKVHSCFCKKGINGTKANRTALLLRSFRYWNRY